MWRGLLQPRHQRRTTRTGEGPHRFFASVTQRPTQQPITPPLGVVCSKLHSFERSWPPQIVCLSNWNDKTVSRRSVQI
jgi:hypothetical protein